MKFSDLFFNHQYLSYITLSFATCYFLLISIDMTILLFKPKYTQPLFIWKFEHFLFYVSFSFSFSVYILFWIAFHITEVPLSKQTAWYMGNAALRHDCVLVILYIELFLNNILFKWKHLIIPSLSIAVYIAFNW